MKDFFLLVIESDEGAKHSHDRTDCFVAKKASRNNRYNQLGDFYLFIKKDLCMMLKTKYEFNKAKFSKSPNSIIFVAQILNIFYEN